MRRKSEKIVDAILDEDDCFELANISPANTGLRHMVWISDNSHSRHKRPRMKARGSDHEFYPVSVDSKIEFLAGWPPGWTAKDFQELQQFITLNHQVIMAHWDMSMDSKDALARIQSIKTKL